MSGIDEADYKKFIARVAHYRAELEPLEPDSVMERGAWIVAMAEVIAAQIVKTALLRRDVNAGLLEGLEGLHVGLVSSMQLEVAKQTRNLQ